MCAKRRSDEGDLGIDHIRLSTPLLDFWVDLRLFSSEDRWMAVAVIADEPEIGLGMSRHEAIGRALEALGTEAATAFVESLGRTDRGGREDLPAT